MSHKGDKCFHIEYTYADRVWMIDIYADDDADAMRKLHAAATTGRVLGEGGFSIPLPNWHWVGRIVAWWFSRAKR